MANLSDRNGCSSTIHSMIYHFERLSKEYAENEEPVVDKDGQLLVFEPTKLNENAEPETIYIIDEASMVSDINSKDVTQAKVWRGTLTEGTP